MSEPLYSVDARIANIFVTPEGDEVDKETGEVLDAGTLDALQMERAEKIDNILCFIKNLRADAAGYKAEAEYQKKRYDRNIKKITALKSYLAEHMEPGKKFESAHGEIRWRKSDAAEVDDLDALPSEYKKVTVNVKADYMGLRKAMKNGVVIPGARLVDRQNMQIK